MLPFLGWVFKNSVRLGVGGLPSQQNSANLRKLQKRPGVFVRCCKPLGRVAVAWPVTGKDSHFSSTIYSAVFITVEGDTVSHSADSARFLNRFSSSTTFPPFLLSTFAPMDNACVPLTFQPTSAFPPLWKLASWRCLLYPGN